MMRVSVLVFLMMLSGASFSQSTPSEVVYKFQVQGIIAPQDAKAIQAYFLLEQGATSCSFIDELDYFKLGLPNAVNYAWLKGRLNTNGYALTGKVLVSDGSVLYPTSDLEDE